MTLILEDGVGVAGDDGPAEIGVPAPPIFNFNLGALPSPDGPGVLILGRGLMTAAGFATSGTSIGTGGGGIARSLCALA